MGPLGAGRKALLWTMGIIRYRGAFSDDRRIGAEIAQNWRSFDMISVTGVEIHAGIGVARKAFNMWSLALPTRMLA